MQLMKNGPAGFSSSPMIHCHCHGENKILTMSSIVLVKAYFMFVLAFCLEHFVLVLRGGARIVRLGEGEGEIDNTSISNA